MVRGITVSLKSFRSFRGPLFCKPVTGQELFCWSKPALLPILLGTDPSLGFQFQEFYCPYYVAYAFCTPWFISCLKQILYFIQTSLLPPNNISINGTIWLLNHATFQSSFSSSPLSFTSLVPSKGGSSDFSCSFSSIAIWRNFFSSFLKVMNTTKTTTPLIKNKSIIGLIQTTDAHKIKIEYSFTYSAVRCCLGLLLKALPIWPVLIYRMLTVPTYCQCFWVFWNSLAQCRYLCKIRMTTE